MNVAYLQEKIAELEQIRQSRVILYMGQSRGHFKHFITDDDVLPLFQCLRRVGSVERLDLILYTTGGSIATTHSICHLLHSYGSHIGVLLPYKARSAGTLLCLGAHEVIMGPLAELSPIDPQIMQAKTSHLESVPMISSEDIRQFQLMAKAWFGIQDGEHNMDLLRLLCERIFPTSLSGFFRSQQQICTVAEELLRIQLPNTDPENRQRIVTHLIHGYHAHDHAIMRNEATQLGLCISPSSLKEEELLWQIWEICDQYIIPPVLLTQQMVATKNSSCLIASVNFSAKYVMQTAEEIERPLQENTAPDGQSPLQMRWEIAES